LPIGTEYDVDMSRIHPDFSDSADVLLREEPDEEEDEQQDDGKEKEDDDDDDTDDGYSE
jgi:hypothetical protein